VLDLTGEVAAAWVCLKISVATTGIGYSEITALDIFEFFTLLREVQRRNKPK